MNQKKTHIPREFIITPMLLFAVILVMTFYFYRYENLLLQQKIREEAQVEMNDVYLKFSSNALEDLSFVKGLKYLIESNPDITQDEFVDYAVNIVGGSPRYRNVAAARDLVISHMYPVAGNEAAIGLNYRNIASQWPAVKAAIDQKNIIMAGPINLVQGGRGFIFRVPVILKSGTAEEKLWGIISAVMDYDAVVSVLVPQENSHIVYALRVSSAHEDGGRMLWGDRSLFLDPYSNIMNIGLSNDNWQLAAKLTNVELSWQDYWRVWAVDALVIVIVALYMWMKISNQAQLRQSMRQTEYSERLYRFLFRKSGAAIFTLDTETGRVFEANDSAYRLLQYENDALNGIPLRQVFDNGAEIEAALPTLANLDKSQVVFENHMLKHNGEMVATETVITGFRLSNVWHYQIIARDVSQHRQQREALMTAKEEAEHANQLKTALLANTSHDLRTPLGGIMGVLDLVKHEDLPLESRRMLDMASDASQQMLELINDIIDTARLEEGEVHLRHDVFNLADAIDRSFKVAKISAQRKGIDVSCDVGFDLGLYTIGDEVRIRQVIANLLSNAIKFTDQGSVRLQASGLMVGQTLELKLSVTDTGVGISADEQKLLFRRFQQVGMSAEKALKGSGLGLSICKQLVTLMGGDVGFTSELGQGSEFWFSLSLPIADDDAVASYQQRKAPVAQMVIENQRAIDDAVGLKILVAEDNQVNQMLILKYLEALQCQCMIASNGLEVLALLEDLSPEDKGYDVILMDIKMPELDGIETTKRIRASGKFYQDITIIALTANVSDGDIRTYENIGMNAFLAKPIAVEALKQVLKGLKD